MVGMTISKACKKFSEKNTEVKREEIIIVVRSGDHKKSIEKIQNLSDS